MMYVMQCMVTNRTQAPGDNPTDSIANGIVDFRWHGQEMCILHTATLSNMQGRWKYFPIGANGGSHVKE